VWCGLVEDKSAANIYCWVAAWFPDLFCNFYLVKNHNHVYNSATAEARKNKRRFGILRILGKF
jgi:hypothetical protein